MHVARCMIMQSFESGYSSVGVVVPAAGHNWARAVRPSGPATGQRHRPCDWQSKLLFPCHSNNSALHWSSRTGPSWVWQERKEGRPEPAWQASPAVLMASIPSMRAISCGLRVRAYLTSLSRCGDLYARSHPHTYKPAWNGVMQMQCTPYGPVSTSTCFYLPPLLLPWVRVLLLEMADITK
jgi:hypothetical protein